MRKNALFLSIFLIPICVFSQTQTLTGKIVDNNTKKPIHNAQILVSGQNIGTVSNENGIFNLHIENLDDSVIITHIGYKTKIIGLKQLKKENIIYLQFQAIDLPSYNTAKLTPVNVVRLAYNSICQNYDTTIFSYKANVSYKKYDAQKVYFDGDFVFDIFTSYGYPDFIKYNSNFHFCLIKGIERIKIKLYEKEEERLTKKKDKDSSSFQSSAHNILNELMDKRPNKLPPFLHPKYQKKYKYKFINGANDNYFYVSFFPKHSMRQYYNESGVITIDKDDFSIIAYFYEDIIKICTGISLKIIGKNKHEVRYTKKEDKYYLEKLTSIFETENASDINKNHLKNLKLEIISVNQDNTKAIDPTYCLNPIDNFEDLSEKYKEKFNQ